MHAVPTLGKRLIKVPNLKSLRRPYGVLLRDVEAMARKSILTFHIAPEL